MTQAPSQEQRMATDSTPYSELRNTIRIVEACLKAGKPDRIVPRLRQGRSAEDVEAELAAEAARPPERTAARTPASAQATNDALRDAIERRFRAQNRRTGSQL
jgi:hypothetical protein